MGSVRFPAEGAETLVERIHRHLLIVNSVCHHGWLWCPVVWVKHQFRRYYKVGFSGGLTSADLESQCGWATSHQVKT